MTEQTLMSRFGEATDPAAAEFAISVLSKYYNHNNDDGS
jgi:hypothetical protein